MWSLAADSLSVSQPTPINIQKPSERNKMLYSFTAQTDGSADKHTRRASACVTKCSICAVYKSGHVMFILRSEYNFLKPNTSEYICFINVWP